MVKTGYTIENKRRIFAAITQRGCGMKRLMYIITLVTTFLFGGLLCELSYETKVVADCDANCFFRKHYLLGHCVLTEYLDAPFLNGGSFIIPPRSMLKHPADRRLMLISSKQYIDYDPRNLFDICRVRRGQAILELIEKEEASFCRTKASQRVRDSFFTNIASQCTEINHCEIQGDLFK